MRLSDAWTPMSAAARTPKVQQQLLLDGCCSFCAMYLFYTFGLLFRMDLHAYVSAFIGTIAAAAQRQQQHVRRLSRRLRSRLRSRSTGGAATTKAIMLFVAGC